MCCSLVLRAAHASDRTGRDIKVRSAQIVPPICATTLQAGRRRVSKDAKSPASAASEDREQEQACRSAKRCKSSETRNVERLSTRVITLSMKTRSHECSNEAAVMGTHSETRRANRRVSAD